MRPHSRIIKKLRELQKNSAPEGSGHGHGHGHGHGDGIVDYSKGTDSYLNILKPQVTLHQDLEVLQTLARPGEQAEKAKKKKDDHHHHHEETKKKKKKGPFKHVSYKDEHAGHDHLEEDMARIEKEKNINQLIKDRCKARYGYQTDGVQGQMYIEVATKFFKNCQRMKMSLDKVAMPEAQVFGYILNDFREIETVQLWSDVMTIEKLKTVKSFYRPPDVLLNKYKKSKLTYDRCDNIRVIRQLRFLMAGS